MTTTTTPPPAPAAAPPAKVVALCGSLRAGSHSRMALDVAMEGVKKGGAEVIVADLSVLPLFDAGPASREHPETVRFKELVKGADGLLFVTPVYHDSYSGVLKNALDLLLDDLADKVAALVAVGGGRVGQGQALEHLRAVLREMSVWVLPKQVVIHESAGAFEQNGLPKDRDASTRLLSLGLELVLRCKQLRLPKRR